MEVDNKEYQYNCYIKLFKILKPYLTNKKLVKKIDNFSLDKDVDIVWSLISTSLLMSEREYEDKKIYQLLDNNSFEMFSNILEKQQPVEEFESIYNNCLLDYNGNVTCDIARFYMTDLLDEFFCDLYVEEYPEFECNSEADELEKEYQDNYFYHEANDSIIIDNELDFKSLFRMVRNCLAHSHYEVINENYIRLYHYNNSTKKLDLNIVLSNVAVLTILNELNEIQYKKEAKIENSSSYGFMLNELVYKRNQNGILWDALGYYEYLRDDFFGFCGDFVEVNVNSKLKSELIILSLLNTLILYGYNENDDVSYLDDVNLSELSVNQEILNTYRAERSIYYDQSINIKKRALEKLKEVIDKYKKSYEANKDRNIEYFRNLPTKISELEKDYENEEINYNKYAIEKDICLDRETKNFILRHIRNSIAHGNIRFERNLVIIEDYDDGNLTFEAKISVTELISILLDENLISKIFDVELKRKINIKG